MSKKLLVTVPKLTLPGGVSSFWNALLPEFSKMEELNVTTLEIGGHGKNILGPIRDQLKFKKRSQESFDLVVLNPSLGGRSFFRDAFFAQHLTKKNIPFALFFHGWNLQFQDKVDTKYRSFFLRTLGNAKLIFVLSSDFKQKLIQWGFKGIIVVATTTVDSSLLRNQVHHEPKPIDKEVISILFLSRLLKEKGIYETITAFKNLQLKYPNIQLVIAGNGKEYEPIKAYVKDVNQIKMVGHVEGEDKIELFKRCDIYCLPSYSEGLPTSVLEAMAFGKPVVTTKVGGLKDFFQNGQMGFFVKTKDVIDLENKLLQLIDDKELRSTIGSFNYECAHNHVVSSKVSKKMATAFLSL